MTGGPDRVSDLEWSGVVNVPSNEVPKVHPGPPVGAHLILPADSGKALPEIPVRSRTCSM